MTITSVPTNLGSSFVIKVFLPGFMASILYSYAIIPIIPPTFLYSLIIENKFIAWILSGILLGMVISSLDFYIYQFFEGIRFWPEKLWEWKFNKVCSHFENVDNDLKEVEKNIQEIEKKKNQTRKDKNELSKLIKKSSSLWAKVREYPYDPTNAFFCNRYPQEATRLGNVLAEYESYSENQYGMHIIIFWHHLWIIFPKYIRDDLNLRVAKADFSIYFSFIFFCNIFIGSIGFFFQQNTWINILNYSIPLGTIICFFISIILSICFYNISIQSNKAYGRYIKALFDIYRIDLLVKLKTDCDSTVIPNDLERGKWQTYRNFLLDYVKPNK